MKQLWVRYMLWYLNLCRKAEFNEHRYHFLEEARLRTRISATRGNPKTVGDWAHLVRCAEWHREHRQHVAKKLEDLDKRIIEYRAQDTRSPF